MDMAIIRLVHGQILPVVEDTEAVELLNQLLHLVESAGNLQTQPSETAQEALDHFQRFNRSGEWLSRLSENIRGGQILSVHEWLCLCDLAALKFLLTSGWDDYYAVIFEAYSDLGTEARAALARIERVPFHAAVDILERDWDTCRRTAGFETVALSFVRASGRIGALGTTRLYQKVSDYLSFEREFLVVFLAAACFKAPAIASQAAIEKWTDSQYACMKLLDNFADLGDPAWG
jgi:hypothetical protein